MAYKPLPKSPRVLIAQNGRAPAGEMDEIEQMISALPAAQPKPMPITPNPVMSDGFETELARLQLGIKENAAKRKLGEEEAANQGGWKGALLGGGLGLLSGLAGKPEMALNTIDAMRAPNKARLSALDVEAKTLNENLSKLGLSRAEQKAKLEQGRLDKDRAFQDRKDLMAFGASLRPEKPLSGRNDPASVQNTSSLRKEYLSQQPVKDFSTIDSSYRKIVKAAENPSAAGDLSLIFSYMKVLDPGSTVREGEFANAQNAAGIPDQIRNQYNRAKSGERLNPNQRTDFVNQATNLYSSAREAAAPHMDRYKKLAESQGIDPDKVVFMSDSVAAPKSDALTPAEKAELEALEKKYGGK